MDFKSILNMFNVEEMKQQLNDNKVCIGTVIAASIMGVWMLPIIVVGYLAVKTYVGYNEVTDEADDGYEDSDDVVEGIDALAEGGVNDLLDEIEPDEDTGKK